MRQKKKKRKEKSSVGQTASGKIVHPKIPWRGQNAGKSESKRTLRNKHGGAASGRFQPQTRNQSRSGGGPTDGRRQDPSTRTRTRTKTPVSSQFIHWIVRRKKNSNKSRPHISFLAEESHTCSMHGAKIELTPSVFCSGPDSTSTRPPMWRGSGRCHHSKPVVSPGQDQPA